MAKTKKAKADTAQSGSLPLAMLVPNIVTLIGLCFGLFAIRFALFQKWELAVGLIVIAAFIDGIDGKLARLLNATSNFGAQLDTLADFFNFSVAPALVLYMWIGHEIKAIGWGISVFFIICGALRLARFNAGLDDNEVDPRIKDNFFEGVNAPCAAGLSLLPMILTFLFNSEFDGVGFIEITPVLVLGYMIFIALLMVSRIPTISLKKAKVKSEFKMLVIALAVLYFAALIAKPWIILPLTGVGYILTIPYTVYAYYKIVGKVG